MEDFEVKDIKEVNEKLETEKNKFETISLKKLREKDEVNSLSDKDYVIWDFMVTASIESMTYKNDEKDSICIKLNSIMFRG